MKILVLAEDYPNSAGGVANAYIHTRSLYYAARGIDVVVLNFRAKEPDVVDGIRVLAGDAWQAEEPFDLLVLHAANVKHHYRFLRRFGDRFPGYVFFYHGHEVLNIRRTYSRPYPYVKRGAAKDLAQECYDAFKLAVWRRYLPKVAFKSRFVFVSRWMEEQFFRWTGIPRESLEGRCCITYNGVGELFEKGSFDDSREKQYDFVTVRSNLDGSKYAVDIVNRLAFNTPQCRFLLIGRGRFFDHFEKAPNLEWRDTTMDHAHIAQALDASRFALMPTRTDAQGLMMCEMAAYGIPVVTSDIPVCHEVFDGFGNVFFIDNDDASADLAEISGRPSRCVKDTSFFSADTLDREVTNVFYDLHTGV